MSKIKKHDKIKEEKIKLELTRIYLQKILTLKTFSKKLLILVKAAKIFDFSYRDLVFFCCDAFGFIIRDVDFSFLLRKQYQDTFNKSSRLVFCSEFLDGSNFSLETDVKNLVKTQEYKEKQIQNLKKKMLLSSKSIPYIDLFLFFCESLSSIIDDKNFFSKILDFTKKRYGISSEADFPRLK